MPEEGGAAGEAGAPVGGSAGSGLGGMGGISGGAMGGTAGGGMGGTAGGGTGGGGTGSAGEGPIVIFDGPIADALVLYDGGADGPNGNYNGRTGLDQRCATAMTALALPHAKSIAFISVDETDHIQSLPSNHQVPEDKPIVSKTKVMLADNWVGLMGDGALVGPRLKVSLKRAEVVPVNAKRWLTGSTSNGQQDINYSCSNWTSAAYSTTIRGRIGSVSVATQTSSPNVIRGWLSDLFVTCDTGESHVLCLAY